MQLPTDQGKRHDMAVYVYGAVEDDGTVRSMHHRTRGWLRIKKNETMAVLLFVENLRISLTFQTCIVLLVSVVSKFL